MGAEWLQLLATGGGGGFVGFIGGALQTRFTAEGRYNARVDQRLKELEEAVEDCRKRDGHIAVLSLGLKMVVPELQRNDRKNPVLNHVATALSALPAEDKTFDQLLEQLRHVPYRPDEGASK